MFDNFVECLNLVIVTLVISNSLSIVSPLDEFRYGLAIDCTEKGMNK